MNDGTEYESIAREIINCHQDFFGLDRIEPKQEVAGASGTSWEIDALGSVLPDLDDLSAPIADLEPDGKGVPVLVRQYAKLGGRLLAFSVDPQFGNTLDGFVIVDLTRTAPANLARYLGKEGSQLFLRWHAASSARVA